MRRARRLLILAAAVAMVSTATSAAAAQPRRVAAAHGIPGGCQLANGVHHVVEIGFDNVHFFRDNPNVPSDLELMPHLRNFIEDNGTMLSNNHTPLIAHTADDFLTTTPGCTETGTACRSATPTGRTTATAPPTRRARSRTGPTRCSTRPRPPERRPRHQPVDGVLAHPPGDRASRHRRTRITPAPWVPFTRAGCDVGDVSTANMVLENTAVDIPKVFGTGVSGDRAAAEPTPTRSRTPRWPTTSVSPSTAREERGLRPTRKA